MQNSLTEIQVRTPEATRPEQASRKDQQPSRRQDLKRPSGSTGTFRRKIMNSNGETCWLNSGLQMILCSLDHSQSFQSVSSLGFNMELNQAEELIDPSTIKLLIQTEININDIRQQNILTGYQDTKDLLVLLGENKVSWPDIYSHLYHTTVQKITCESCQAESISESVEQLFFEYHCPPDNTSLKSHLEGNINYGSSITYRCNMCHETGEARQQHQIKTEASSMYFLITLQRIGEDYYKNRVDATKELTLLDSNNHPRNYFPISIIHHRGGIQSGRNISQHYMCDVFCQRDQMWYHTSDSSEPRQLRKDEVSKTGYIILFRRKS